jgi:N-acetyl-anhydromuramyl-L-alanine amidase AmpD
MNHRRSVSKWSAFPWLVLVLGAVASGADVRVGQAVPRLGDEIVVCGQLVHTTARVVLWMDPGGYDAYRVERRFGPPEPKDAKGREHIGFGRRRVDLSPEQAERVHGGGWDLPLLQQFVDQFVIHYDARGTSRSCFEILHDIRGLAVHFMLDLDGTIYQTLDLKEGAHHATIANGRSVGVEIANMGAYPVDGPDALAKFYETDTSGGVRVLIPPGEEVGKTLGPGWVARPSRPRPIVGDIHGRTLRQYDLTPEQYQALIKLTATLCKIFPKIKCDYPRDGSGRLVTTRLPANVYKSYEGVLGHYHVQDNKTDPGPAFQWDKVIDSARVVLGEPALKPDPGGSSRR